MLTVLIALTLLQTQPPAIAGPDVVPEGKLVRLSATNPPPKSALLWRLPQSADRATQCSKDRIEFAAPPGEHTVELWVVTFDAEGAPSIADLSKKVTVGKAPPPVAPPPSPKADPVKALNRIQFGNAGCTATIIGPRRADGRWDILTAAHCTTDGARGVMLMPDGRRIGVTVMIRETQSDLCWIRTDDSVPDLPFAELAPELPAVGSKVWHQGFGVDRPGNREEGTVTRHHPDQTEFSLSVSSGDSGGGICLDADGRVVASVCCTQVLGGKGPMYGGTSVMAAKLRARLASDREWTPIPIPQRMPPKPAKE